MKLFFIYTDRGKMLKTDWDEQNNILKMNKFSLVWHKTNSVSGTLRIELINGQLFTKTWPVG